MHNEFLTQMNFELTTKCPLRCPQCYCTLENGRDLDIARAKAVLGEAARHGLKQAALSGGESMVYPHLRELVAACAAHGVVSHVALSGWGVDAQSLRGLIDAGVTQLFVSLNGATEEINRHTRGGYGLAMNTLALLQKAQFPRTVINFVAHNTNCADFPNMVRLCEKYDVAAIVVMAAKPTSDRELSTLPTPAQTRQLAADIRSTRSKVYVNVESCYSPLRAYLGNSFLFVNTNRGVEKGCTAGRDTVSLSVDGKFTPCRHLDFEEEVESVRDYWDNSPVLRRLRGIEDNPAPPCAGCEYEKFCLPCLAINHKTEGKLEKRFKNCPIG